MSIQSVAVTVYGGPSWSQCRLTVNLMEREGIAHTYVDATEDPVAEQYVRDNFPTMRIPAVVIDWGGDMGTSSWQGFRPDLINSIKENAA